MTEQQKKYQKTLQAARELDPEVDLVAGHHPRGYGLAQGREERRTRKDLRSKTWTWQRRPAGSDHENPKEVYQQADMAGMYRVVSQAVGRLRGR